MGVEVAPLRADAERNREALVAAAGEVFRERGVDAPLDVIARRAGVGNATLYRRFPTRRDLLVAVFTEQMAAYAGAVRRALEDPDPWSGFAGYVHEVCRMQAEDRALADLITTSFPGREHELDALRAQSYGDLVKLVRRVQEAGALRADFRAEDVIMLLMANAGVVERIGRHAPEATERLVALLLDGLRAGAAGAGAPPPLSRDIAFAALERHAS